MLRAQKWLEVTLEQDKQMKMFKSCRTVREAFTQHKSTHPGLLYRRIPLPECSAPREEVGIWSGVFFSQGWHMHAPKSHKVEAEGDFTTVCLQQHPGNGFGDLLFPVQQTVVFEIVT